MIRRHKRKPLWRDYHVTNAPFASAHAGFPPGSPGGRGSQMFPVLEARTPAPHPDARKAQGYPPPGAQKPSPATGTQESLC